MDWALRSAVAQVIGSAAIVITLGYLAAQVRQNTNAMQAAAREATAARDVEWLYTLVDHPELGPLFRKEDQGSQFQTIQIRRSGPGDMGELSKLDRQRSALSAARAGGGSTSANTCSTRSYRRRYRLTCARHR